MVSDIADLSQIRGVLMTPESQKYVRKIHPADWHFQIN